MLQNWKKNKTTLLDLTQVFKISFFFFFSKPSTDTVVVKKAKVFSSMGPLNSICLKQRESGVGNFENCFLLNCSPDILNILTVLILYWCWLKTILLVKLASLSLLLWPIAN